MVIHGRKVGTFYDPASYRKIEGWLSMDVWKSHEQSIGKSVSQRVRVPLRCRLWRRTVRASIGIFTKRIPMDFIGLGVLLPFNLVMIPLSWYTNLSCSFMLKELVLALQAVRRCVKAMPSLLFADRLQELKCEKSIPAGQRASLRSLRFTMFFGMYSAPYQSMCIVKSSNRLLHEDIWCIPRCTFTARMWQIFKPVQSLGHSRMHG